MKKNIITFILLLSFIDGYSQWTQSGNIITTTNQVGVGTTTPGLTLDVNGDMKVRKNMVMNNGSRITPYLNDNFTYDGKTMGQYSIKWDSDSWNPSGVTLLQSGWAGIKFFTGSKVRLAIHYNGKIGIGTITPKSELDVAGTIRAKEIKVEINAGADHVFKSGYNLKSLTEVESFIMENNHLPEIPSEKQMQQDGLNVNEFQIKLLQKIEELTLYVIELKKESEVQQTQIEQQKELIQLFMQKN